MPWEIVVVMTHGYCAIETVPTKAEAAIRAAQIAREGLVEEERQCITMPHHIGHIHWKELKEKAS
jgi:hypothetical protein